MSSNAFDLLASAVRDGDSIRLTLTRSAGKLEALIVPALKNVDESDTNAERATLLGALARPWKVDAADGESIEQAIADSLHASGDARTGAMAALDELNAALNDAAARARTKAVASKGKTAAKATPVKPDKKASVKVTTTPITTHKAAADNPASGVAETPTAPVSEPPPTTPAAEKAAAAADTMPSLFA